MGHRRGPHTPAPDIVAFLKDDQLLGLSLSEAQEALLRAIYGLPMSPEQRAIFLACTGRTEPRAEGFGEVTVLAGARSGKDSRIAASVVCYEAVFGGHEHQLARGERAIIPLVAQDQRATRIAFGYIRDYLTQSPLLASMVEEVLASEIALTNRVSVYCFPCTQRSLRGWSIPAAVLDELAFFRLEGQADSDAEVQASIRRGMLSFLAPRLVKISTPYMKSGVLYDDFRKHFGQDSPDVLVWRASSLLMNPSLRVERLERERRLDPDRYAREYEAEFAEDLEAFLPSAWVDQAMVAGRHELPPRLGVQYVAAVDPSGGGADAFTLAIVHVEGRGAATERRVVQDVMRGWGRRGSHTLDLVGVVKEIAEIVKRYGCSAVTGDRYAGQWVRQAFGEARVAYRESERTKAEAYLEIEPLCAQGQIEVLDHAALTRELKTLERRARAGGKPLVDHPHGGHDDYANALALAAAVALKSRGRGAPRLALGPITVEPVEPAPAKADRPERRLTLRDLEKLSGIVAHRKEEHHG